MKKLIGSFFALLIVTAGFVPPVYASSHMRGGETVLLAEDEIIESDYFAGGDNVTVSGIVKGDAYVAGNRVIVDGTVNGDLLVAGGDIEIRGKVGGDVRAAGSSVNVYGTVGGNLTVGAGKVYISDTASLVGSIVAGAGEMTVATPVGKGITAGVGKLTVEDKVGGDINYWSDQDLVMGKDASVSGAVTKHETKVGDQKANAERAKSALSGAAFGFGLIGLLGSFLIGSILFKMAPRIAEGVTAEMKQKPWLSMLLGFTAMIMIPVSFVIFLMTVVGIPLAFLVILLFIVGCMFAKILASLFLGQKVLALFTAKPNRYGSLLVGLILYGLISVVPVLGWLVSSVLFLMALGSMLLYKREFYLSLREKKLV